MSAATLIDLPLEAQCRRIAALSMAIQQASGSSRTQEVLDLAEALDTHFGWEPFRDAEEEPDDFTQAALGCLRVARPEDLDRAIERLPVFPLAAQRALDLILRTDWNMWDLAPIAGSDQALAANIIRAANSTEGRTNETLDEAISRLGSDRTSRILYAAAVQPMFSSPALRDLWHHSVASAEVARGLAEISGAIEPKHGFLAGLVHDIGVLALSSFPPPFGSLHRQLTQLGCEGILAERALAGMSHAEAGARALQAWKFASEFSQAVEFHHCPERSSNKLSALLYLTEQWTDSNEDAPSAARFRFALKALRLSEAQFADFSPVSDSAFFCL
jgi:HD-like signal output (HDOD) protein